MGLNHWITKLTFPKSRNILDLVLTSEPDHIESLEVMAHYLAVTIVLFPLTAYSLIYLLMFLL